MSIAHVTKQIIPATVPYLAVFYVCSNDDPEKLDHFYTEPVVCWTLSTHKEQDMLYEAIEGFIESGDTELEPTCFYSNFLRYVPSSDLPSKEESLIELAKDKLALSKIRLATGVCEPIGFYPDLE